MNERFKIVETLKVNGLGERERIFLIKERVLWFFWYTLRYELPHMTWIAEFSTPEEAQQKVNELLSKMYSYKSMF